MYLAVSVALFCLGSFVALAPIGYVSEKYFPKPYYRRSFAKKLAIVGGGELVALAIFVGYAWIMFDPIVDRSFRELMSTVSRLLVASAVLQCVVWPAIRWLLARAPSNPNIRRSALTAR